MDLLPSLPPKECIDRFCNPLQESAAQTAALNSLLISVHSKKVGVEELVQLLGEYLTSIDDRVRARGTLCLGEILARLPNTPLNQKSVTTFVSFFSDRLKDLPCANEALVGLGALAKNHQFTEGQEKIIFKKLGDEELIIQTYSISTRNKVIELIRVLTEKYMENIRGEINTHAKAIIRAFDGEKDPRNLTIIFPYVPTLFVEDLDEENTEELFDIISCYFPILFKPGPSDPKDISRDSLASSLRKAMTSHSKIAKYSIPFLLKKLSSVLVETKVESLGTISACIQEYSTDSMEGFWGDIWVAIRSEISEYQSDQTPSSSKNKSVFDAALKTWETLIKKVSRFHAELSESKSRLYPADYLFADCMDCLKGVNTFPFIYYAPLIDATLSASDPELKSHFFAKVLAPFIVNMEEERRKDNLPREIEILCLVPFIKNSSSETSNFDGTSFLKKIFDICLSSLKSPKIHNRPAKASVECIVTMLNLAGVEEFRTEQSREFLAYVSGVITNDSSAEQRDIFITPITHLSERYPEIFISTIMKSILESLSSQTILWEDNTRFGSLVSLIESVSSGSSHIVQHVLKSLSGVCRLLLSSDEKETVSFRIGAVVHSISTILEKSSQLFSHDGNPITPGDVISVLEGVSTKHSLIQRESNDYFLSEFAIRSARALNVGDQRALCCWAASFLNGLNTTDIHSSLLLVIPAAILTNVRTEALPENVTTIIEKFASLIESSSATETKRISFQTISAIINKIEEDSMTVQYFDAWKNKLLESDLSCDSDKSVAAGLGWLMKSSMMRHSKAVTNLIESLVGLFGTSKGLLVGEVFDVAFGVSTHLLCKESFSKIKVLYHQKYFNIIYQQLLSTFRSLSPSDERNAVLLSLTTLLSHQPPAVVIVQDDCVPICVQALQSENSNLQRCGINLVHTLVNGDLDSVIKHLHSIFPALLRGLKSKKAETKTKVVESLRQLSKVPIQKVIPYRDGVVEGLIPLLSDASRSVRKNAAVCRSTWITITYNEK